MKKNSARAKNYAKALFQLSLELKNTDKIGSSLKTIKPLAGKEITGFFSNPFIDEDTKTGVIKKFFPDMPETVFNLLSFLIKKNEMRLIPDIEEKFDRLILSAKNTVRAKVVSAEKLENASIEKIKSLIEKITKNNVLLEQEIDKSLFAGIIIKAGATVIDGSIKGKIGLINRELLK